jgi:TRAP-type C4-dicarboxylate transport system permease small subunit
MRNEIRILAIILVVAGVLGLIYGGFSYTKDTHDAKIGPVQINIQEKERVRVPVWAGVALVVAGTGILLVRAKK